MHVEHVRLLVLLRDRYVLLLCSWMYLFSCECKSYSFHFVDHVNDPQLLHS
ncbi:hypothetical protein ANCCEY_10293 [Ancylostoma ceylanicum]|uniref:Uncharacterized protein n=1 Tax=Ancylostoma ceylanicum TaxID=53326 RepID=A0A0D6LHG4_9BILA|nr:hypothetical protein ANCCEY_10293 [Ancylostoma ceylanicum]